MQKTSIKKYMIAALVCAALLFVDQWTKQMAINYLFGGSDITLIPGVLDLHYLENTGAAFSIMENKTLFFCIITPMLCAFMIYLYAKLPEKREYTSLRIILVFLVAGAVGNLIDRVWHHYVVDFIYFSLINFPVFNVADIYVTCGVICLFILILFVYSDQQFDEILHAVYHKKQENK